MSTLLETFKSKVRSSPSIAPFYHRAARFVQIAKHFGQYRQARGWAQEYDRIIAFFGGIGDDLMLTSVLRGLNQSGLKRVAVLSNYPELFEGNPDVAAVLPKRLPQFTFLEDKKELRILEYRPLPLRDHIALDEAHNVSFHFCDQAGVSMPCELRPWLYFGEKSCLLGEPKKPRICIQSSSMNARYPTPNKDWGADRFQQVVDALKSDFEVVQLGIAQDPLLENTLDLRGRTSLRESAAILASSVLFVGLEGFLMHLARAVDIRSVIIYGGRLRPWQIGYPCNENLWTQPPCSPCYHREICEHDRICLSEISPNLALSAVDRALAKRGQAMETESFRP